ncbi:MAG: endonuclease/exonuclease/phosphatase family protein, partial [Deltaproteobacteria bacterium]|nr:endonuclease/exonuclease/phosphatase family protein [Deltaproteobacteria bacterium]
MKTKKFFSLMIVFSSLFLVMGMASKKPKSSPNISIMTYNVENLFDVADDPDKDDAAFLPLALKQSQAHKDNCNQIQVKKWRDECLYLDWSQEKLDQKIANLVRNILQVNHGQGPDILVVQEIENIHVVDMLAKALDQGYKYTALIEGRDVRGIDIGVISKIPLQDEAKIHYVDFKGISVKEKQDTRGIFEASFALPKTSKNKTETLVVYGVHFPAPYHKKEFRIQSFAKLNQLLQSHGKDVLAVAVGDFNVTS